ncbi:hypothetical protein [Luteitalea sp. TBR-22]|uniref:hypothetical protein n=1 Tax=Luteitalea sp. TBR-22 TaxID=2802971 RepID=UPI001EF45720|nr:hypothetical protein [Luteitalea sp. TBR-22]
MNQRAHPSFNRPEALQRVVGEYLEMPGLSLSASQAARLWHLDARQCEQLLEVLVDRHFLHRTSRGLYVRPSQH